MTLRAIKLHRSARVLELLLDDGQATKQFEIPLELLRVYGTSSELTTTVDGVLPPPVSGKKNVGADRVEAVGNYAIRLHFDDGYSASLYSFEFLRKVATTQAELWQSYLDRLKRHNLSRLPVIPTAAAR